VDTTTDHVRNIATQLPGVMTGLTLRTDQHNGTTATNPATTPTGTSIRRDNGVAETVGSVRTENPAVRGSTGPTPAYKVQEPGR